MDAKVKLGMEPVGITGSAFKWRSIDGWHEFHTALLIRPFIQKLIMHK
jgi:hypothetical protein